MKKIPAILSAAAIALLSACSQTTPSTDSKLESAIETTAYIYEGQYKMFDADLIKQIFIPEFDSLTDDDFDSEQTRIGTNSVRIKGESGQGLYYYYPLKDGRSLLWDAGTVWFVNNLDDNAASMNSSVFGVYPTEELVHEQYPLKEIEGFSSEQALEMAQEIVDKLDIPNIGQPQIYTCPGKENYWDGENFFDTCDAYYIFYPIEIDGAELPYEYTDFQSVGWTSNYGFVDILISKEGLEYFDANEISDYREKESCAIISREEATEILSDTIGKATEIGGASFSDGSLTYVADSDRQTGKSLLYPAWKFLKTYKMYYTLEDGSTMEQECYQYIYIDAQSGNLLSWGD